MELSYNLGLLLQAAGENKQAAECYQIAVDKKPDFPEALLNLGHALKAVGKRRSQTGVEQGGQRGSGVGGKYFH